MLFFAFIICVPISCPVTRDNTCKNILTISVIEIIRWRPSTAARSSALSKNEKSRTYGNIYKIVT